MGKGRIEAFSDGVIAIIITIMVLELKTPHGPGLRDLLAIWPVFLSYALSFIYVGIYWNNHHHMFHAVKSVTGGTLWANLHLLFWLSLTPFTTAWMAEDHFESFPVALYGLVLALCGAAYTILVRVLLRHHAKDSQLARAAQGDHRDWLSVIAYAIGIALAFVLPYASLAIYALVALFWLIPSRRFEHILRSESA
jgi:uncharacterized membrane protein